jgi:hypothetical protein
MSISEILKIFCRNVHVTDIGGKVSNMIEYFFLARCSNASGLGAYAHELRGTSKPTWYY